MGLDRRGTVMRHRLEHNPQGEDARAEAKPFEISKQEVVKAYKRVRAKWTEWIWRSSSGM